MTRAEVERYMRSQLQRGCRELFLCRAVGWPVSVKQLAARTGLSEVTVRSYLKNRRRSRPETARRIENAIVAIALAH